MSHTACGPSWRRFKITGEPDSCSVGVVVRRHVCSLHAMLCGPGARQCILCPTASKDNTLLTPFCIGAWLPSRASTASVRRGMHPAQCGPSRVVGASACGILSSHARRLQGCTWWALWHNSVCIAYTPILECYQHENNTPQFPTTCSTPRIAPSGLRRRDVLRLATGGNGAPPCWAGRSAVSVRARCGQLLARFRYIPPSTNRLIMPSSASQESRPGD